MKRRVKPKVLTLQSSGAVARLAGAMALARLDWPARSVLIDEAKNVISNLINAAQGPR